ncbi:MAG TPA: quinone oxidoreductase [Polyangiaceae bacterium]|nr:quinone oxidoreductase [Polyangiaceae bacterium]
MRAIRVSAAGGPEVMHVVELPTPRPGPGEALVAVEAAGVNYVDVYQRSGAYSRELPFSPGEEGAGVVEAVGPGVDDPRPGDRVAWASVGGSYATHVVARADRLVVVPDGVSARLAAAVMLQGMTAHYLAHATRPLGRGDTVLVHAAAGGVGLLLVQMAKRAGARVLGTTSTDAKATLAREAGADDVVLYAQAPFDEAVRARTGGRGVDVVYDSVGAATFDRSLLALRPRGMLVLFGQSSGRVPPFDLQTLNARGSLYVTRPTLRDYVATRGELVERARAVLSAVRSGELNVRIHAELPLEAAPEAHRALESRATSGKVLLVPGGASGGAANGHERRRQNVPTQP